jgi:hypothetical protein
MEAAIPCVLNRFDNDDDDDDEERQNRRQPPTTRSKTIEFFKLKYKCIFLVSMCILCVIQAVYLILKSVVEDAELTTRLFDFMESFAAKETAAAAAAAATAANFSL